MKKGAKSPLLIIFFKKINATASNTYTYEFELICGPDNSLKNFKFLQKLDYCRVIEGTGGNAKFVNYLRNPIILGETSTHLPVISLHISEYICYKHGDTTTQYIYKYYNDTDGYYTDALCCFASTTLGDKYVVTDYATTFSNKTRYIKKQEFIDNKSFPFFTDVSYITGETDMAYVYKCVKTDKYNNIEVTKYKVKETNENNFTRINNTYDPSSISPIYTFTLLV